MQGVSFKVA
jgi:hypothetical protein